MSQDIPDGPSFNWASVTLVLTSSGTAESENPLLGRFPRPLTALLICVALADAAAAVSAQATAPSTSAEVSGAAIAPLGPAKFERWATISETIEGYYYDAGQQDSHLVITRVSGGVRFADTNTDVLRSKPDACREEVAPVGIVVVCGVPAEVDAGHPMTLKVFTRLGDDYIEASSLTTAFELYMLADAGRDVVRAGAGNDFVNGAKGGDRVRGGAGNDWIRTGLGRDRIRGGAGDDRLVGVYARDRIYGGKGNDRVGGGDGNDLLFAGEGTDFVLCGTGTDDAHVDQQDRVQEDCESVELS